MDLTITELQQYNSAILKEVGRICDENGIHYFGMFGTLLGAIRHKGTIPWDPDVDIAVPMSQIDAFVKAMEENLPEEYFVDYRNNRDKVRLFPRVGLKNYDTHYLHVDVYPLIGLPDSIKKQKRLFWWVRLIVGIYGARAYSYTGSKGKQAKLIKIATFMISDRMLARIYDWLFSKYPYETSERIGCSMCVRGYKRTFAKKDVSETILVDYEDFKLRVPAAYDRVLHTLYKSPMTFPPEKERIEPMNTIYHIEEV